VPGSSRGIPALFAPVFAVDRAVPEHPSENVKERLMTTVLAGPGVELAQRTAIRAFRAGRYVLIVAQGDLPTPGYDVDIAPSPLRIFPQQFNLLRRERPGIWPQIVTPYRYGEAVVFPDDQPVVTVHHADGQDRVPIEQCGDELRDFAAAVSGSPDLPCPAGAVQATGFSRNLSFDEAFSDALAGLPPVETPDALTRIRVLEVGALLGGIAGFRDLFVRVCRLS
jgi:hypothetical protein